MILIDTSAWIEYLRDTSSPACEEVDRLLDEAAATTDPVVLEVLAGARGDKHLRELQSLLARSTLLRCCSADYLRAAELFRQCRRNGETVRKHFDCLIAAVAIRTESPLLHRDSDFDAIERHSELVVHRG